MPKKIEEKNTKGSKKTTKQSNPKKVNGTKSNKKLNSSTEKKVIEIKKVPETKLEIKDVYVEKYYHHSHYQFLKALNYFYLINLKISLDHNSNIFHFLSHYNFFQPIYIL